VARIGVGIGNTPPALTDTELDDPWFKNVDGYTYPAVGQVKFTFAINNDEANGMDIQEFGLMDSADLVLFARRTKAIGLKTVDMQILGEWTVQFA